MDIKQADLLYECHGRLYYETRSGSVNKRNPTVKVLPKACIACEGALVEEGGGGREEKDSRERREELLRPIAHTIPASAT